MTRELKGAPFQLGMVRDKMPQQYGSCWYLSRKDIENFSPSRKDGIDSRKESELRICYSTYLKDLGIKLRMPQVTIATSIIFCHRFYLHQSHARNDWQTIATVCMFLASKVEDTPVLLEKVIVHAYEMIHKDPTTARKIHQKDVFEKQKALILIGERLLLSTVRFDFNIQHPYRPLLLALKKFGMTQKDVRQVAWNFINDSLRTTLCLQYKAHYIAAGSLLLAARVHNVNLPSGRDYVWWHEFDVTPQQLQAAIQEMMELLGCRKKPVVACALEKPTQALPLAAKEEASSSPDSCVLSRPSSSRSSSSQCFDGDGGRQATRKLNLDAVPASAPSGTELKPQAVDSESPDSVVEDSQGSGEGMAGPRVKPEGIAEVASCHGPGEGAGLARIPELVGQNKGCDRSGEDVDKLRVKPELIADNASYHKQGEGADRVRKLEQVSEAACCHGHGEGVDQGSTPEQVVDATICHRHSDRRSTPEQVAEAASCYGLDEGEDQARTSEQAVDAASCHGLDEDRAWTPEQAADVFSCHGHDEGMDRASTPEQVADVVSCHVHNEGVDLPRIKPEQVVSIEDCQGSGEGPGQTGTNPEKFTEGLSRIDVERIKAMVKRRKREREPPSSSDQGAAIEECRGSSEGLDQKRRKPEEATNRLGRIDMDRIKAMVKRRKREREANERKEAMDECSEDAWIERELETGIELKAEPNAKKQKMG